MIGGGDFLLCQKCSRVEDSWNIVFSMALKGAKNWLGFSSYESRIVYLIKLQKLCSWVFVYFRRKTENVASWTKFSCVNFIDGMIVPLAWICLYVMYGGDCFQHFKMQYGSLCLLMLAFGVSAFELSRD